MTTVSVPAKPVFTWEEEGASSLKSVITVYGAKGVGKTSTVLGLSGRIYVLSFDGKTKRVHEGMYGGDPRITVLDARKYWEEAKEKMTAAGEKSVAWIDFLLEDIKRRGDAQWIVWDYWPTAAKMAEMAMRKMHGVQPGQGISNRGAWEDRNIILRRWHRKSLDAVTGPQKDKHCGTVFVTYIKSDPVVVKDGETWESMKKPNYQDIIEQETDIVARMDMESDEKATKHIITFESNKLYSPSAKTGIGSVKNGQGFDLAGRTLAQAVDGL